MHELISQHMERMKARSMHTQKSYEYVLNDFFAFAASSGDPTITVDLVQRYVNHLSEKNAASTVRHRFTLIRSFFRFSDVDIRLHRVALPRRVIKEERILDGVLLDRYFTEAKSLRRKPRLRTLLMLLPYTGVRVAEACGDRYNEDYNGIHKKDITRLGGSYFIRVRGKNLRERVVPLDDEIKDIVLQYAHTLKPSEKLFPITSSAVKGLIKRVGKRINAPWLHAHTLRHTFITILMRRGVEPKRIQDIVGHANLATTMSYVHTTPEEKHEAVAGMYGVPGYDGRRVTLEP